MSELHLHCMISKKSGIVVATFQSDAMRTLEVMFSIVIVRPTYLPTSHRRPYEVTQH
jgi:hypothetical protein